MISMTFTIITALHLATLGQFEGGADNIKHAGRFGEITRFQVLPAELHRHGYGTADVEDLAGATLVCGRIWQERVTLFELAQGKPATPAQLYLLWHRPARPLSPKPVERQRAERFANLYEKLAHDQ